MLQLLKKVFNRKNTMKSSLVQTYFKHKKAMLLDILEVNGGKMMSISWKDGRGIERKVNGRSYVTKYKGTSSCCMGGVVFPYINILDIRTAIPYLIPLKDITRVALGGVVISYKEQ